MVNLRKNSRTLFKGKDERIAADNEIKESVNNLKTLHINDKAALEAKIAEETANRTMQILYWILRLTRKSLIVRLIL